MKKTPRTLVSLLCVCVCLITLAAPAFAADYDFQGKEGQSLKLLSPDDITVESEDGVYLNTINTPLSNEKDIIFKLTMSSGMNNFSEDTFVSVNLPQISVCDTYGGNVVAAPAYVSGSGNGIELAIPAGTLADGSYVLVFGKDIQANNASKVLGQDIVFQFTVSADAVPDESETPGVPETPADPETPSVTQCPYTDVDAAYVEAVIALIEQDFLTPQSETLLGANRQVTRGEFIALMGRCRGINASKYTTSSYTDLPDTDPNMPYIMWAAEKGIMVGYGGGLFGASDNITREQAACVLYAYAKAFDADNKDASTSIGSYADGKTVSDWAKDAVKWAVATEVLTVDSDNNLNPSTYVSCQEMAALIYEVVSIR